MIPSIPSQLEPVLEAVREAARLCTSVQRTVTDDVLEKKDKSPVTVADFGSQALVLRAVREAFPEDPIIAEEGSAELRKDENSHLRDRMMNEINTIRPDATFEDVASWIDFGDNREGGDRFWTLDPIDGTKGFLRGEQYAISLGMLEEGEIKLGILALPNFGSFLPEVGDTGVLFIAVRGEGVAAQPLSGGAFVEVKVSGLEDVSKARFCESVESGHSDHSWSGQVAKRLGITEESVRMDSQAKYGALSMGAADIYLRLPTRPGYREMIWDHAAGVIVVEEAGGKVSDVDGKPLDFTRGYRLEENRGVIVSCGPFHQQIVDTVIEVEKNL
ncbi:3'(2'),5'-bisphosphate nucleotidase [bacterium]|nr:3'(2'),5'-bisphosphate nucleotidase [bacterium]